MIDDKIINAENLSEHFCDIGPKLNAKVPVYENIHSSDFLVPNDDNSTLESFTEESSEKIKTYITSLSSDKAITDQLPLRIMKSILPIIISSITYILYSKS